MLQALFEILGQWGIYLAETVGEAAGIHLSPGLGSMGVVLLEVAVAGFLLQFINLGLGFFLILRQLFDREALVEEVG